MKLSVAIMAHPNRREAAEELERQLRAMPFDWVSIVYATKFDDTPHENEWDTGAKSLSYGIGKGSWHLVIQDDAILTSYFFENVVAAITSVPSKSLISLYTGQARPFPRKVQVAVDKAADGDWLRYWILLWGVGIVLPSDHIEPLLEFVEDREEPYDTRIGMFYQRNMLPVYYTMPSLVDHGDGGKSLLPGHGILPGQRVAHRPATERVEFSDTIIDM